MLERGRERERERERERKNVVILSAAKNPCISSLF